MSATVDFQGAVTECLMNRDFIREFNRLYDTNIAIREMARTPLDRLIDEACKVPPIIWTDKERETFFQFVMQFVWLPLVEQRAAAS